MMDDKFAEKFKIDSAPLANRDYSRPENYFLTICTCNHNNFFGKIVDENMVYEQCGEIVKYELLKTFQIRKNLKLIDWVLMPNHVHILFSVGDFQVETPGLASQSQNISNINAKYEFPVLNSKINKTSTDENYNKETPGLASLQGNRKIALINYNHKNHPNYFPRLSKKSKQLIPKIIQQYKSAVT